MPTYVVIDGDTFDLISRKVYGEESKAALIQKANPGVVEPLSQATILNVPTDPNSPKDQPQQLTSNNPAQVTISVRSFEEIDGVTTRVTKQFTIWESITIKRSLDSLSTIAVRAPFEADNEAMREFFRPFTFNEIKVSVGGNTLFVGTIINIVPRLTTNASTVEISAYSLPGILSDCNATVKTPLAYVDATLDDIATDQAVTFGVRVIFDDPPGDVFANVTTSPTKTVLSFLQDLAKQRNLVIGDTRDGSLLFQRSTQLGFPVARLQQGSSPLVSVTPSFNAQKSFTSITGIGTIQIDVVNSKGESEDKTIESSYTVHTGILGGRYHNFTVKDTENSSLKEAVEAKVGRMFGNMATYTCTVATLFDAFGSIWTPNTTVKLLAPNAMVYEEFEFIIRSVELRITSNSQTATLDLVLPGSFSGEIPARLPWE